MFYVLQDTLAIKALFLFPLLYQKGFIIIIFIIIKFLFRFEELFMVYLTVYFVIWIFQT